MTHESAFIMATLNAEAALNAADRFPHGFRRDEARENLKAAIAWIKQARDEWAEREEAQ